MDFLTYRHVFIILLLAVFAGCTQQKNSEDLKEQTAQATAEVKRDAQAVAAGSRAKHGRYAAEDVIEEAQHTVKERPLQAMGVIFAAGLLAGGFLAWIGFRRR